MPIGSILLGLALGLVVAPFVISPFLKDNRRKATARVDHDPTAPELAKRDAIVALRDLDFDFRTGKIVDEDHTLLRQRLLAAAAQAMQAADEADLDTQIEAAVRGVRTTYAAKARACPHCRTPVAAESKFCSQCGKALEMACPRCKRAVQVGDKFCAGCGAPLNLKATVVV